ncbi:MAG TPA: hypothetical protein VK603_03665 [Candidatus Saccharimonadales bacterium]|nr:hypothetical protein [Candidatus Saccharimonadales bacterium]
MVMNVDVRRQANPTLAVIDGGLNVAAGVQAISTPPKPKLLDQVRQAITRNDGGASAKTSPSCQATTRGRS